MSQILFPILRYRDPQAAMTWLEQALGFEREAVHEGDDGTVQHAELRFRGSRIMIGTAQDPEASAYAKIAPPPGSAAVYVVVDDPDALHARVVEAGGDIVMPLTDLDYGSRDFAARDPEGNLWSFGTYSPERSG
jgi:uncharacterized glyoxalase superfamily protein PhnB